MATARLANKSTRIGPELVLGTTPPNSRDILKDSLKVLEEVIGGAGFTGRWKVRPTEQQTWKSAACFKVLRMGTSSACGTPNILVRCKPGDNGTCWNWELLPPDTVPLLIALRRLSEWNNYDGMNKPKPLALIDADEDRDAAPEEPTVDLESLLADKGEPVASPVVPIKSTALPPAVTDESIGKLTDRIASLQKAAAEHRQREQKLAQFPPKLESLQAQIAALEEEYLQLDALHQADKAGREALAALHTLASLVGV